jgi:Transposase IS66 family
MWCCRKLKSLHMILMALALHALLAYFGVATCNTGCGRKPQNQCSIHLLAPTDNRKSFTFLLISNAPVSSRNETCKRYANLKCQQLYVAPLPGRVKEARYDATCDATIALMRYGGGLPWHRQAGLQAMGEAPLGEATMWERCEATADAAMGIFLRLMRLAADGEVMYTDDTWVRILSCLKEDKEEKGRATQTSGIVVKAGGRKIALFLSGRRHAGENLAGLLAKREKRFTPPIQMSDALAPNKSVEKNVARVYCLAHARRKVFELIDDYPVDGGSIHHGAGEFRLMDYCFVEWML